MDAFSLALSLLPGRLGEGVAYLVLICALSDAVFPVPGPRSKWVKLRKIVSAIGLNVASARNRILPGSHEATVTPADIVRKVEETHAEAAATRAVILAAVAKEPVPPAKAAV